MANPTEHDRIPPSWVAPSSDRVPIEIHPEVMLDLRHTLSNDPTCHGIGYSQFIHFALKAYKLGEWEIDRSENPPVKEFNYGYCPICSAPGISRERRLNGNDMCSNMHKYPSILRTMEIDRE